jgi:hypothetical protein
VPILVRYAPPSMTVEQYEQVSQRLRADGAWPPASGLIMHVCFGSGDQMRVSEIWESRGALEAFQERLFPLLQELMGADMRAHPPEILDVHRLETAANAASA